MLNKCINCCKWITCNNATENNCKNFKFKRIEYERKEKYEKRKRCEKNNKTTL